MTDGNAPDPEIGALGRAEAARSAAFLEAVLPDALRPVFGESFIRSHHLYGEFVCRLVLGIAREIGLDAVLALPGPTGAIVERAALDASQAPVPLDWMLRYLAGRGWIGTQVAEGEPRYHAGGSWPAADPVPVREEQRRYDPSWMPAYALAETMARDYPAFLRGQITGEDVLFAPRRLRLWVDYFSNENGLYAVNNRVGAVAALEWLPDPPGIILEVGGGLASGALALLDRLATTGRLAALAGYRFTEFVPAFLRRGEQTLRTRYPELPGLTFGSLDMNRPFDEQGVARASVSMVYAVNTLHAARDLEFTLREVRHALAPGGRLVVSECVRPSEPIYADFVFNLTEAFRSPHLDRRFRPHGGFLTPEHWQVAIEAAGFRDVSYVPDILHIRAAVPDFSVAAIGAVRRTEG